VSARLRTVPAPPPAAGATPREAPGVYAVLLPLMAPLSERTEHQIGKACSLAGERHQTRPATAAIIDMPIQLSLGDGQRVHQLGWEEVNVDCHAGPPACFADDTC
jgi:hypothetical protein